MDGQQKRTCVAANQVTEMHAYKWTCMKTSSSLLSLSLNDSLLWTNETRYDLLYALHVDLLIFYCFSLQNNEKTLYDTCFLSLLRYICIVVPSCLKSSSGLRLRCQNGRHMCFSSNITMTESKWNMTRWVRHVTRIIDANAYKGFPEG